MGKNLNEFVLRDSESGILLLLLYSDVDLV